MSTKNAKIRMTPKYFWCSKSFIDLSKISKEERAELRKILKYYQSMSITFSQFNKTENSLNRYFREVDQQECSHYNVVCSMLYSVHHLFNAPLEILEGYVPK